MAKKETGKDGGEAEKKGSALGKILLWVVVGLVLVAGTAGATLYMTGGLDSLLGKAAGSTEGDPSAPAQSAAVQAPAPVKPLAPPQYLSLDPPFVVNFEDQGMLRYLQISVSVMGRDKAVMDLVLSHSPQIRNDLIMLFGNQDYATLNSAEGKEKLRQQALEKIQEILRREIGQPGVEAVYFTNFVMQ